MLDITWLRFSLSNISAINSNSNVLRVTPHIYGARHHANFCDTPIGPYHESMDQLWPYVENDDLIKEVRSVIRQIEEETESIDIHRNVLDPFSALFDMTKQNVGFDNWIEQEKSRQAQKTLQNAVGYFHQKLLGYVDGWHDPGEGGSFDLLSDEYEIVAEIKNKHNTTNSTSESGTYRKLAHHLDNDKKGYTGYFVNIIPSSAHRMNKPFAPSESGYKHEERGDLRKVDGATFYEIVTGDPDALRKLYECLPEAISHALSFTGDRITSDEDRRKLEELFEKAYGKKTD